MKSENRRDFFAGLAMHSIYSGPVNLANEVIAKEAYAMADAMIAEREKTLAEVFGKVDTGKREGDIA